MENTGELLAMVSQDLGDGISSGGSGRREKGDRGARRALGLEREGYQDAGSSVERCENEQRAFEHTAFSSDIL